MQKEVDFLHYFGRAQRTYNKKHARVSFLRAIREKPNDGDVNFRFARFLKDDKEAEFRFRKASILAPKRSLVYNDWGLFLDRQGRLDGQEELFRKTVELEPSFVEALCNLGAVLTEKGKFEEAMAFFEKAYQKKPNHLNCNNSLGSLYLILGKYEQAVEKLQKAIGLQKTYYLPYMNLTLVYYCMGKDAEAKENREKGYEILKSLKDEDERKWILREYKKLLKSANENLLEEGGDDDGKRSHNERFSKALEEIISLLLEQ